MTNYTDEIFVSLTDIYDIKIKLIRDNEQSDYYAGGVLESSSLKQDDASDEFNAAMNAIESMVLGHAIAGIDVTSVGYKYGLQTAIDATANRYGD